MVSPFKLTDRGGKGAHLSIYQFTMSYLPRVRKGKLVPEEGNGIKRRGEKKNGTGHIKRARMLNREWHKLTAFIYKL